MGREWRWDVVEHLERELHVDPHETEVCEVELPLKEWSPLQPWTGPVPPFPGPSGSFRSVRVRGVIRKDSRPHTARAPVDGNSSRTPSDPSPVSSGPFPKDSPFFQSRHSLSPLCVPDGSRCPTPLFFRATLTPFPVHTFSECLVDSLPRLRISFKSVTPDSPTLPPCTSSPGYPDPTACVVLFGPGGTGCPTPTLSASLGSQLRLRKSPSGRVRLGHRVS